MIARRALPPDHAAWNHRWRAPFGLQLKGYRHHLDRFPMLKASLCGPFAFQPTSETRRGEFPWAFYAAPITPGLRVLEIGGAHSGFQFALAREGATVTNVDPMVDYGGPAYTHDPDPLHAVLNRAFHTHVTMLVSTIGTAGLESASFDRAYSISTLEHLEPEAYKEVLRETRRVLKPGGLFVLTVDLFLNLAPFTTRQRNRYGRNLSIAQLVHDADMEMIAGDRTELYGFPEFTTDGVLGNLAHLIIGGYPALAQMFVLRKP